MLFTWTVNPFTEEHCKDQCDRFGLFWQSDQEEYESGNVKLKWVTPHGRLDDYLNVNMRFMEFPIPIMTIDGAIWMSLTPMEIQSAHCAIAMSKGIVATSGLGLGYFAMEAARKPEVTKIYVFEQNEDVIRIFRNRMKYDPDVWKIHIIKGDVREKMKGFVFDFVFMDPYQAMLPDELITDADMFRKENDIAIYWPWGMELITYLSLELGNVDVSQLYEEEKDLFRHHGTTSAIADTRRSDIMLSDLRCPVEVEGHEDYIEEAWEAIGRL